MELRRDAHPLHDFHPRVTLGQAVLGASAVGKGWFVSALMHYQRGSPGTATDSVAIGGDPNVGTAIGGRANIVAGRAIEFSGTCSNAHAIGWVNPAGFAPESALGAWAMPVNNVIAPACYRWDLSLRNVQFAQGRYGPAIPGGAYDASNQTNWSSLHGFRVNNLGGSSLGQIIRSFPTRVLHFGAKLSF